MKKLFFTLLLAIAATFAWADHDSALWDPQGFPEDELRGDWFATIDLDAVDYAITRTSEITRKGPTAIRFEFRDVDVRRVQGD